MVVAPVGNARLLRSAGVRRIEELDWWDETHACAWPITLTPAQHFSARTPYDRNRALWGGFVFVVDRRRFYFAGDSAYTTAFSEIRQRLGAPDVALIPIGAYEPRWFMKAVHMNPAEAVQAHLDLESRQSIASHFGTFQLTAEGIDAPVTELGNACDARRVPRAQFRALEFGASFAVA
jgi:L-ascorbate metabolism protein UlaG (beta-lactamase superfamily)